MWSFAFKTNPCNVQTLPCRVQWPFHLLSCKCHWLFQLSGICTELFFPLPRLPPGPSNPSLQRPVAFPVVLQSSKSNATGFSSFFQIKCQWLLQLSGICTELFFPLPRLPPGPFKPFPAASSGLWNGCVQKPMAFPAAELFFPVPRLPPGPFKPFPAASSGLSCCLAIFQIKCQWLFQFLPNQMPVAFAVVGDLHRAVFSASKTPSNLSLQRLVAFGTVAC